MAQNRQAKPQAVGYVRVSTAEQVDGFGLAAQRKVIRDYCRSNGLRLVATFADEGVSGSNGLETRIGLAEALAALRAGSGACLVVYRLDRLARDLILQETLVQRLRDQGTPVRSATEADLDTDTDDPTKVLIRQIVGAVGQYERAVIRGRMMAGKAAKRDQGGYAGGRPPYGKKAEGRQLVDDPETAKVVALVGRLRGEGRSYRDIANSLTERGYRPRPKRRQDDPGPKWHPTTIRRIVERLP